MTYRDFVREIAAVDDGAFAEYVSDLRFPAHLREAAAFAASHSRSVLLLPRGHAKTTAAVHHLARRIGVTRGRCKIGIATAAEPDAIARSRAIRALVTSARFAEVFPWAAAGVESAKWTERAWTVAGAEAYVEKDATVRAGSLAGFKPGPRFDLLLCDDLVGRDACATAGARRAASERFWSVIEPMHTPTGQIIVLGTRWHEDDWYAELAARGWPVHLRAALDPDGAALWPAYWPADKLLAKRIELSSAIFDLQYQNDPRGMGGNIVRREWFTTIAADQVPRSAHRVGVDLAASTGERADYTAAVEWAEDAENNLYLFGAWRARLDGGHRAWLTGFGTDGRPVTGELALGPRLLWPVRDLPPSWPGARGVPEVPRFLTAVNIEASTFQSTFVMEMLANTRLPARKVYPDRDKETRARALAARYEAGRVFHVQGAPGLAELEAELTAFPNGEHDDLVDAAVYGADLGGTELYYTSARA